MKLTPQIYAEQKLACDNLCDIDHDRIAADDPNKMPCVTCPFCKETVDAILTRTTIACPECKVVVER